MPSDEGLDTGNPRRGEVRMECIDCGSANLDEVSKRKRQCRDCGAEFYVAPVDTKRFSKRNWWVFTIAMAAIVAVTFAIGGMYALYGDWKYGLIFAGLGVLFAVGERERIEEVIRLAR